jgi:Putative peptidoglycan binding domain
MRPTRPISATLAAATLALSLLAATGPATASALTEGYHPYGRSMWIWYLDRSDGGNLAAIAARAHAAQVHTLFVKAADGTNVWSQFSSALVRTLHGSGLRVCAWQYVYGTQPAGEAALGAQAAREGADCLVVDAEAEYEGRYAQAQTYIDDLRAAVGRHYAIGLASFPYVDYHPAFPYSVFLGPGGANFSLPQMYWGDIGSSVDTVFAHTVTVNRIYDRAIYPTGQTYGAATAAGVVRFRELTKAYAALGLSWWDYAWTTAGGLWGAIEQLLWDPLGFAGPTSAFPALGRGAAGDEVVWLQEHLARAYPAQHVSGLFAADTVADLRRFQAAHRLVPTGVTDPATWRALLALRPVPIAWTAGARGARATAARVEPPPASAALPAVAYEVPERCRAGNGARCPAAGPAPQAG